ncbi:type 1 periplasmic-binding domain-containing protein [Noviherbaspirillum autotrophicum]|uniref:Restriction endonuclease type IV Mrr domain-containing protein n=1 Tax=Noviherbaspirillum autotrophicum TaxID=709839 RepID=A0A0C2BKN2_9BURK|nr:hypothetical protein [Noviherbaspirillum autotrophicum]KIF81795.1 hypothetical protein TSA66_14900 [Noviherbaspirillum autotrophicum]
MANKATIRSVVGARLRDSVPPPYRPEIVKGVRSDGQYTLILCAHAERDVVSSAELERAFRRLDVPAPDGIIVVGTVFTEEAKALATEHGARIVALRSAKWTDESARLRQL